MYFGPLSPKNVKLLIDFQKVTRKLQIFKNWHKTKSPKLKVRSVPFKRRHLGITECYKFYVHICCRNGSHNGAITVIVIFQPIGKKIAEKKLKVVITQFFRLLDRESI